MRARVCAVTQSHVFARSVQANRERMLALLRDVFAAQPDLVCLPEAFTAKNVPVSDVSDVAETVPGPTTDLLAAEARRHRCHIVCPIYTEREGAFRNSAVLLGREGEVLGVYDKLHPCVTSSDGSVFEEGVVPGADASWFDLDIGRVAMRICMDVHFPEDWRALAAAGVRAVPFPSAYESGALLRAHATINELYVISAVRTGRAQIVDPCGVVIAESTRATPFALADIALDFAVGHHDLAPSIPNRVREDLAGRVTVRDHLDAGSFLVEPLDAAMTLDELRAEVGFEPTAHVVARHREAYRRFALNARDAHRTEG